VTVGFKRLNKTYDANSTTADKRNSVHYVYSILYV
jgi:hypothetical protein